MPESTVSESPARKSRRGRTRRILLIALASLFAVTGTAFAVGGGLTNISFEDGLNGWETAVFRDGAYSTVMDCSDPAHSIDSVCLVDGNDTFPGYTYGSSTPTTVSVSPRDGSKMVRLGGPFIDSSVRQPLNRYLLKQTFTVDPADPIVRFTYNVFTYDYSGFDALRMRVRLIDDSGEVVAEQIQGSFGSGVALKTTGWRGFVADLTGYEGQTLRLAIDAGGTLDTLYGFWAYIDGGDAPAPLPSPIASVPAQPGGGATSISKSSDESGNTEFVVPSSQVANLGGSLPLTLTFSIPAAEGAVVSNVKLRWSARYSSCGWSPITASATGSGPFTATVNVPCTGDLSLIYTVTEGGESQEFIIPYGGISLIDPQGVIYDQNGYNASAAAGLSADAARAANAIVGASVKLQRKSGGSWVNVLASDPGISPHVNPQITGADGKFQWDVSAGEYRVVVTAAGYPTTTSGSFHIPPPKLDAHIGLSKPTIGGPITGSNPIPAVVPCAGKTGKSLAKCKLDLKITNTCTKGSKAVKSACATRLRALDKCASISKAKKRNACKAKAQKAYNKAVAKAKKSKKKKK